MTILTQAHDTAQVLGGVGDGGRFASSINTFRDRRPISRQSLVVKPGVDLALKSEKLTVHSFEQMVRSQSRTSSLSKCLGIASWCLFDVKRQALRTACQRVLANQSQQKRAKHHTTIFQTRCYNMFLSLRVFEDRCRWEMFQNSLPLVLDLF